MSNPVQGWYADPEGSDQLRWWDGTQWSDQFRPAPTGGETASEAAPQPTTPVEPPPTGAPVQAPGTTQPATVKPAPGKPTAQPPASQIVTAGLLTLLAFFFIGGAALAAITYVDSGEEVQQAQSDYDQAKQKLQEAKDAAK